MQSYSHYDSSANSAICKTSCSSNNHDVVYIEDRWPIAKACISEATSQKNAQYGEQTRAVGSSLTGRRVNLVDIRGSMVSNKQTNSLNRHVNHTAGDRHFARTRHECTNTFINAPRLNIHLTFLHQLHHSRSSLVYFCIVLYLRRQILPNTCLGPFN
jgi:hypothetical protein